ncbi:hypothetical protein EV121DRAFT_294494 [Schizophyllum commune]
MTPKNASSNKGFPWEDLKAETLRSISLDLLQGTSGKSYLISRTRDTNIAFLKSVAEHGVEEAVRLAIENAPEPQSTSASAARRSASASAPVKRKRDEREEGASNRSTRSKGRADYPYGTRNQGKPQKQLEALGITGPKRQRKSVSARPGPLSRTKKGKGASAVKGESNTKPASQATKATKLVFDGVEIPKSAAANAFDSISQNGDAEDDDAEGEEEGEGEEGAEQVEQAQEEQSGEEWEQTADETMKVDAPAPSTADKSANPYEPSTGDEQEEQQPELEQHADAEEHQEEEHPEEPPHTDEAQVGEHEQSTAEDEPPLNGEIVEATPSEEQNSPAGEIQDSSSAEVGTALEDPYVGGDEDAAGEPETDPMQADEGPVDATNDESVMGMQLDVAPENLVSAV